MVYSPSRNAGRLGSPGTGHPAAGLPPFELKTTFIKPQPHGPHFRFSPNGGDSKKSRGAVDFGNPQNRWRPLLSRQSSSRALTSAARQERCQLPEKDVGRVPRSSEGFPKAHANMGGGGFSNWEPNNNLSGCRSQESALSRNCVKVVRGPQKHVISPWAAPESVQTMCCQRGPDRQSGTFVHTTATAGGELET